MKSITVLELNEFNFDLLKRASSRYKNIKKLTSLYQTSTQTEDTYESDFLEPWVQWVSIHTGVPSTLHNIKHLGDVPHLETPQIWEKLSDLGITSGVWGAMNANRANAKNCLFFLPDPWTGSETATPDELNDLLTPLRYTSKNYVKLSTSVLVQEMRRLFTFLRSNQMTLKLVREIPQLIKNLIQYRKEHFPFISLLDYLSTHLFLSYKKRYNPNFTILFLNSLAHLQHHHWKKKSEPLEIGFRYMDRILGAIFEELRPNEIFLCTNGLSQKNTNDEKPWILYRQIDQKTFLQTIGVPFTKVDSHMTHDAHIYFDSAEKCELGRAILEKTEVEGQKLFLVEKYHQNEQKLFYKVCFTDETPPHSELRVNEKTFPFFSLFKPIVQRTGKHIPEGTIFCNEPIFPQVIKNHELFDFLLKPHKKGALEQAVY